MSFVVRMLFDGVFWNENQSSHAGELERRKISQGVIKLLVIVIGLNGVQFCLYSYEWEQNGTTVQ